MSLARGRGALGVHLPRGVQRHQPRGLHLRRGVGDPVLHGLLLGQRRAAGLAVERALAEHVERAAATTPSQRMQWWMRPGPEPVLGDEEAGALVAEQAVGRARARPRSGSRRGCRACRTSSSSGAPSSATSRTMFTPGVSAGTMIIDARWCGRASGSVTAMTIRKSAIDPFDENHLWPLMTHSSPSRTARRLQLRRVRAGGLGLGHRERRLEVAGQQRVQPALLLLVGPGEREDLAVARVRRLALPNAFGANARGPEDLVHQPELDLAEALAAELGRGARPTARARLTSSCSGA